MAKNVVNFPEMGRSGCVSFKNIENERFWAFWGVKLSGNELKNVLKMSVNDL